jgi:5-methylcytosine-specific restriction protein A
MQIPNLDAFEDKLMEIFNNAKLEGKDFVIVNAGELHREVGGYRGRNHRMPTCNWVMRKHISLGDLIISEPEKGYGASLTIKYKLPR